MLALLAQATDETIDMTGTTIDLSNNAAAQGLVAGMGVFFVVFMLIAFVLGIFTLWMFIDALIRKDEDFATGSKVMWALLIFFLGFIPAIIYFFMVKKKSNGKSGGATPKQEEPKAETPETPAE